MVLEIISNSLESLWASVPAEYRVLFSLLLYTVFIALYAIFIWKFYKFLASKEIIQLNLKH